jgi:anti-sigma factor RsiW
MNCNRARQLFGACWDDELTQAERDVFEAHLASCGSCRQEYDGFSRALELAASLPRVEASPEFVDHVLARSRRAVPAPDVVAAPAPRWVPALAAAAGVVIVAAVLVMGYSLQQAKGPVPGQAPGIVATGGPAEPELVPQAPAQPGTPRPEPARASDDDLFDPDKNVEFVLGSVAVDRGRVKRDPEGQQPVITF